jgi:hypothetical protein
MGIYISILRRRRMKSVKPVRKNSVILYELDLLDKQLSELKEITKKPETKNQVLLKELDTMDSQLYALKADVEILTSRGTKVPL